MSVLYNIYEKLGWNNSFPFTNLVQNNKTAKYLYVNFLRMLSPKDGWNFMEENWDNLIVLDACRFDAFKLVNDIEGKLYMKKSIASSTTEWVKSALKKKYHDVVIVTANPYLSKIKLKQLTGSDDIFYKNIPAWDIGWDDKLNTIPPWVMVEIAKKRLEKWKEKRWIFWFMQPHDPFITRKKFRNVWKLVKLGIIPIKDAWNMYLDNLKIALKYVNNLINYLEGKIVITADHGECFGEMGLFSHLPEVHILPLVNVPYMIIEKVKK